MTRSSKITQPLVAAGGPVQDLDTHTDLPYCSGISFEALVPCTFCTQYGDPRNSSAPSFNVSFFSHARTSYRVEYPRCCPPPDHRYRLSVGNVPASKDILHLELLLILVVELCISDFGVAKSGPGGMVNS